MRFRFKRPVQPDGALWRRWSAVQGAFGILQMIGGIVAPGWQHQQPNSLRTLRVSGGMRRLEAALAGIDDAELDAIIALARINLDRQSYFARLILLAYVTVPLTLVALVAQLAPNGLQAALNESPGGVAGALAGASVAVVIRYVFEAQARALVAALELFKIERDHALRDAAAPAIASANAASTAS